MKKTSLIIFMVLCMVMTVFLSSCFDEESYYTKTDTEALIKTLEEALTEKVSANEAAITALKTEYDAKIKALTDENTALEAELAALEQQVNALLSQHKHTFGDWVHFSGNENVYCENRLFYRICGECRVLEWKQGSAADHDFETVTTTPTCQAGGFDTNTCSTCGKVDVTNHTGKVAHIYKTTYSHDGSYHWYNCQHCDATKDKTEHSVDLTTGYCTVCDQPIAGSEGIIYELSTDGAYAEVIGYEGTATKIVIADTFEGKPVTAIYKHVFKNNDSITSVFIPASVTSIGDWAFHQCSRLASVTFAEGSQLTSIGNHAFYGCSRLTSVTFAEDSRLTSIGSGAFKSCSSLTSITIPAGVTSIGDYAFEQCSRLASIKLSASVISIGDSAFRDCSSLTSVTFAEGSQLTSIGISTFWDCSSLTNISIPANVTSIGEYAFYNCSSLTSVTFAEGSQIESIASNAFVDCTNLQYTQYGNCNYLGTASNPYLVLVDVTSAAYSSYTIHEQTKVIAIRAFYGCERLQSITIPASVTSIGDYAFYDCSSLTSVTFAEVSQLTSIGNYAFLGCSSLPSITIPDGVTSIGYGAFEGCSSLASVRFENTSGWCAYFSTATSGTAISASDLEDASIAAKYLTHTYRSDCWKRG